MDPTLIMIIQSGIYSANDWKDNYLLCVSYTTFSVSLKNAIVVNTSLQVYGNFITKILFYKSRLS